MNSLSPAGIQFIKNFEGCRLIAYKPVLAERYWTIGWGHYGPDVTQGMTVTQKTADIMFLNDIVGYVAGVDKLVTAQINQNQFDALVSFAYNCGVAGLKSSALLRYVNAGNIQGAADEFPRWCHGAGGVTLPGLLARRNKERSIFLTPVITGGDTVKTITKAEADYIIDVLGDYWKRMAGNEPVQKETHRIADKIRDEYGIPKQ